MTGPAAAELNAILAVSRAAGDRNIDAPWPSSICPVGWAAVAANGPSRRRRSAARRRLVRDPFDRDGWLFELKWDGFRAIAETDGAGKVSLYSAKI